MAQYICQRDCFVWNRYHYKDRVYELKDGLDISPKNFLPVGGSAPAKVAVQVTPEVVKQVEKEVASILGEPSPSEQPKPVPAVSEVPKPPVFACDQCERTFVNKFSLAGHLRWHEKQKRLTGG